MARFWTWGVRNTAWFFGALLIAAAAGSVIDWSLGLAGAAVCAMCAEAGRHLAGHAHRRKRRSLRELVAEQEQSAKKHRIDEIEPEVIERYAA